MSTRRERPADSWSRTDRALCAVLVAALLASLGGLVHPWYEASAGVGTGTNDASMYLLCTKSLLAGQGYAYLGQPFTVRPPGFSALLAPLVAWRGFDFRALNLFVSLFGVAAAAGLFALLRPRVGAWIAAATALAMFLNPRFQRMSNQVMSDVPGVALALGCLLLERWSSRRPSWQRELALGAAIGLSAYVRSIAILLVPAILVARLCEQALRREGARAWLRFVRERALLVALVPALLLAPWSLRNAAHAPAAPVDQNYIYSYSTGMWNTDVGDPESPRHTLADVLGRVPARARQVLSLVGTRLETSAGSALDVALGAAVIALALWMLALRRRPSDFFLFAIASVLVVYFGFQDRLALPVFVFALAATAEAAHVALARVLDARRAGAIVAALVLALAVVDFRPRAGWKEVEALHATYRDIAAGVAPRLAADARLGASVGWHLSIYLDQPIWSLLFAMRRAGNVRGGEAVIDKYRLNTVVLTDLSDTERSILPWYRQQYGGEEAGRATIFRVRK